MHLTLLEVFLFILHGAALKDEPVRNLSESQYVLREIFLTTTNSPKNGGKQ